jgi:hypothetical protein
VAWWLSILLSLVANLISSTCCAGGFFAPALHANFVGSAINPNPFGNVFVLLVIFGFISAVFEAAIWSLCKVRPYTAAKSPEELAKLQGFSRQSALAKSLIAHAAGVPLALLILLIPPDPYAVTEARAYYARRMALRLWIAHAIQLRTGDRDVVQPIHSVPELLKGVPPPPDLLNESDPTLVMYQPVFGRLSFGENRSHPWRFECNPKPVPQNAIGSSDDWAVRVYSTVRPSLVLEVKAWLENSTYH